MFDRKNTIRSISDSIFSKKRYMIIGLATLFILLLFHLFLGTSPFILLIASVVIFLSIFILLEFGIENTASVAGFMFIFNTLVFAIVLKTLFLQPLDSNLYRPTYSFMVVLLGVLEIFFAIKIVRVIPTGAPIFKPTKDIKFLKYISVASFLTGMFFWLLNQRFLIDRRASFYSESSSFGGFASFAPVFYMAIVAATAYVIISTNGKKTLNLWVIFLLIMGSIIGLVASRKIELAYTFLSYYLASFYFRRYISKSQITTMAFFVVFAFFVFGPIVHTFRSELWFLNFPQKVDFIRDNWQTVLNKSQLESFLDRVLSRRKSGYDFEYFGRNLFFIDRFATIQHIDLIIDTVEQQERLGSATLTRGYSRVLPRFLYTKKSTISQADEVTWELGLRKFGVIGFPTVPLVGHSFAALGWFGVLVVPFYMFIILFLILKKVGWDLRENIYAIFFLTPLIVNVHQWTHTQYVYRLLREFPLLILLLLLISGVYKIFSIVKKRAVASNA
jgi:hypothetical protein